MARADDPGRAVVRISSCCQRTLTSSEPLKEKEELVSSFVSMIGPYAITIVKSPKHSLPSGAIAPLSTRHSKPPRPLLYPGLRRCRDPCRLVLIHQRPQSISFFCAVSIIRPEPIADLAALKHETYVNEIQIDGRLKSPSHAILRMRPDYRSASALPRSSRITVCYTHW